MERAELNLASRLQICRATPLTANLPSNSDGMWDSHPSLQTAVPGVLGIIYPVFTVFPFHAILPETLWVLLEKESQQKEFAQSYSMSHGQMQWLLGFCATPLVLGTTVLGKC